MKQATLKLMYSFGAFATFRLASRGRTLIVTYHRFSTDECGPATSGRAFEEQLNYLSTHYRVLPLSQIATGLGTGKLPAASAAITIDDGYHDAYEIAFPILRRLGMPATFFVATGFVERNTWLWTDKLRFLTQLTNSRVIDTVVADRSIRLELNGQASRLAAASNVNSALKRIPDEEKDAAITRIARSLGVDLPAKPPPEFGPVTWEQLLEMQSNGIDIGSHTVTHPILTKVTNERLAEELLQSRSLLQSKLGQNVDLFCYPNGSYDRRVRNAVADAGYRCAVTVEPGLNGHDQDLLTLKRISTEQDLAHFAQSTSGFEQLKNRVRYTLRGSLAVEGQSKCVGLLAS
jgi:peptidoglycan/xylan/chitin deacetylase (PgdA/CDA1 family)